MLPSLARANGKITWSAIARPAVPAAQSHAAAGQGHHHSWPRQLAQPNTVLPQFVAADPVARKYPRPARSTGLGPLPRTAG